MHSQSLNEKPLVPWLICSTDGAIITAHCTCMAGVGETCTHAAALSFALDAHSRVKENSTCTGVKAYWKIPASVTGVLPKPAYQIDFSSAEQRKKKLDKLIDNVSVVATPHNGIKPLNCDAEPTQDEMTDFFSKLKQSNRNSNLLKVTPQYCNDYKVAVPCTKSDELNCSPSLSLPADLRDLKRDDLVGKSLKCLQETCRTIEIKVQQFETDLIEQSTQGQSQSKDWFSVRAGRITASNLYAACHTSIDKPAPSLVKKICYPDKVLFSSVQTKWGKEKESQAKEMYRTICEKEHDNFAIRECGIFVPTEYPFMGATPDAMVNCVCHGSGCLEIKCPHKHRKQTIKGAISSDTAFCLTIVDGSIALREDHPYYSQVQAQIFLTKSAYCDFAVWTTVDLAIVRVFPNQMFWDECVTKATALFKMAILPELVGKWLVHDSSVNQNTIAETQEGKESDADAENVIFCLCQKQEYGEMIACDKKGCKIEWFHFGCVGLKRKPKGVWICPPCTGQSTH